MVFCTGFVLAEFPVDCEINGCVAFLGVEVTGGIIGCDVGFGCSFGMVSWGTLGGCGNGCCGCFGCIGCDGESSGCFRFLGCLLGSMFWASEIALFLFGRFPFCNPDVPLLSSLLSVSTVLFVLFSSKILFFKSTTIVCFSFFSSSFCFKTGVAIGIRSIPKFIAAEIM